jgi:CRISPR/Cas system CSM-associated protein Csm3 (group 7 of RAMP superfamily)
MRVTLVRLVIAFVEPGGVSDPQQATKEVDLPIAWDPRAKKDEVRPVIPVTSVAGALRRAPGIAADLVGYAQPGTQEGAPSRIRILHTEVKMPNGSGVEVRTRNAMDRKRGAPRAKHLFAAEQLPEGTQVEVLMTWRDASGNETADFLKALRAFRTRLGRGASVGNGECRAVGVGFRTLDLTDRADLETWLGASGPELFATIPLDAIADAEPPPPLVEVWWRVADALHVGAGEPVEVGGRKVAQMLRIGSAPSVPGTAWKGILRSRCEYVLRSLSISACDDATCAQCATCQLFGHGARRQSRTVEAVSGHRSGVCVLNSKVDADPQHHATEPILDVRTHVAIDRFTGGAAPGLLFATEVVVSGMVCLQIGKLGETPGWARGLLLAAIRDIADGLVGVGAATTRGHGTLQRVDRTGEAMESATAGELAEIRDAVALLSRSDS